MCRACSSAARVSGPPARGTLAGDTFTSSAALFLRGAVSAQAEACKAGTGLAGSSPSGCTPLSDTGMATRDAAASAGRDTGVLGPLTSRPDEGSIELPWDNSLGSHAPAVRGDSHSFLGQFAALWPLCRQRAHICIPFSHRPFLTGRLHPLML